MPPADAILSVLDDLADQFMFPGFNNMNYETADSRLHCFRDGERWALVVEELVDWPGAGGALTIVFVAGAVRGEPLTTLVPIETPIDGSEASGEPIVPDEVMVRGEAVPVDQDAIRALAAEHDVAPGFALLLQLRESHRDLLFATDRELEARVQSGLQCILTLDSWAHPDVYGGPLPSESETFRQLANVLATGDVTEYAPTAPPNNRDWRMWLASR